jgi:foldase protein PrsA
MRAIMSTPIRWFITLAVTALSLTSVAGCGGAAAGTGETHAAKTLSEPTRKPPGQGIVVARVGGHVITKATLEHWMAVGAPKTEVPDPPDYSVCIAHRKAASPSKSAGAGEAVLKRECQQRYRELVKRALAPLISSMWVIGEASERGVGVTDAEVARVFHNYKNRLYKQESAFRSYLATTGQTVADVLSGVRRELASTRIRRLIEVRAGHATPARVKRYFDANKQSFAVPERRDIEAIRTNTRAAIVKAEREVRSGVSFASVARRVSVDRPYNAKGGLMEGIVRGQEEKGFDQAIFAAPIHRLVGPLELRRRYYIFRVRDIVPGRARSFAEVRDQLAQQLPDQLKQQALVEFIRDWRAKWRARTYCRAGYIVQKCRESKASKGEPAEDPYTLE